MSRPTLSSSGRSRLNPTAMEFNPTARTPSKRKASSSASSGSTPTPISSPGLVYPRIRIPADTIFGSSPIASPDPSLTKYVDGLEDYEELEDALFAQTGPVAFPAQGPGRPPRLTTQRRNSRSQSMSSWKSTKPKREKPNKPAVLFVHTPSYQDSTFDDISSTLRQSHYLPLYQHDSNAATADPASYSIHPEHARRIWRTADDVGQSKPTNSLWPMDRVPVEIFEIIAAHLARDDIKSMRLVNKEFEHKVCKSLFRTSVVPFNTELYDMIIDETKASGRQSPPPYKGKGKGKATSADPGESDAWAWRNANEDKEGKVYKGHGLRVFQGFGPHIRRFGMSFEVSESQLSLPPGKQLMDPVNSYHGTYQWPSINYTRFNKLNQLEETADETSQMKAAFSNLSIVSELGLSMRNGLGWLEGPDKSFRAALLQQPPAVFASSRSSQDHLQRQTQDLLWALRGCVELAWPTTNFHELSLEQMSLAVPIDKIAGLKDTSIANTKLWSTIDSEALGAAGFNATPNRVKVLVANGDLADAANVRHPDLSPNELKREQKEWLLETAWAQRAFLESYVLALVDNPTVFSRITTLNIATLSSGLLPMISRVMFWDALPSLSSVTLHVSPDWRTVHKDDAANAETKLQNPTEAIVPFYSLLWSQVLQRESIKNLNVGWADGGEHAQGMYARNVNLLPAPTALLDQTTALRPTDQLLFPHLEHLTLSNCWISPSMLESLVNCHKNQALERITLDSVSLTSYPHPSNHAQQVQQAAAVVMNMQAQMQQNHQAAVNGQAVVNANWHQQQMALAQHFQQQMAQMQQMFNNNPQPQANQNAFAAPPMPPFPPPGLPPMPPPALGPAPLPNVNQPANGGNLPQLPPQWIPQPPLPGANSAAVNPTYWTEDHRQGSWPEVLNKISPGPTFTDYLPPPPAWEDPPPPRPASNLHTLELISCGYAALHHNNSFDQTILLTEFNANERGLSPWFRVRHHALKPYMLDASRDKYLGSILPFMPQREVDAMRYAWGLRMGWTDATKAEEAEFDGCPAGGTGRVSGVIEKGMPLMDQTAAGSSIQAAETNGV